MTCKNAPTPSEAPWPRAPKGSFPSGWCDFIQGVYADPHNAQRVVTGFLWNFLPQISSATRAEEFDLFFLKGEKPQHDLQRIKIEAEAEEGLPP